MNKIQRFFHTATIYFFGNVITKLLSFLMLPIYTSKLAPEAFGEYGLVLSLTSLIIPLVFFQIWDGVFRFSFDYKENEKYSVISNGFFVMIFGVTIYLLLFSIIKDFFSFEGEIIIFIYSSLVGIQYFYSVVARSFQNNKIFVFSGVINSIISISLNIILIVIVELGVISLYISSAVGIIIQCIIIEYKIGCISEIRVKDIDGGKIREMIKFSAPLSISTITQWLLTGFTQLTIVSELGSYANGLFTVANKFSSMLVLIVGVFQFAWNEMAYMLSNEGDADSYYSKTVTEILKISTLGSSILIIFVKVIFPYFINEQYFESILIIPIVIIGTAFNSYSGFLGTIFLAKKQSNRLFITTAISAVANILLLNFLVEPYGLIGAVTSLGISFFIGTVLRVIVLRQYSNISPDKLSYFTIIILFISIYLYYRVENIAYLLLSLVIFIVLFIFIELPIIKKGLMNINSKL